MRNSKIVRRVGILAILFVSASVAPAATFQAVPWWNAAWAHRRLITVAAGPNAPQGGYAGYTARTGSVDTAALIAGGQLLANGNDLRIVRWDGAAWTDLPRHVLGLDTATTDVRFMLAADIPASTSDTSYYLYWANPAASAPPAMTSTNVYRWFDPVASDQLASYATGRVHASGPGSGTLGPTPFTYNVAGYTYDTTNDHNLSLRPAGVTERDVLATYDLYQTGAYDQNMCSGPLVRLTTDGGAPTVENATGFYLYMLCNAGSNPGAAYAGHGDIAQNAVQNGGGAIDGAASAPPQVALNLWHTVGVAAWGAGPTNLKGWYVDTPGTFDLGLFGVTATLTANQAAGTDTTASGQAGLYVNQDIGQVRNIVVRRYIEPEPAPTLGTVENVGPPPPPPPPRTQKVGNPHMCGCDAIYGLPSPALLLAMAAAAALLRRRRGL